MKNIWVYQLSLAAALTLPASAQISISIGIAPPPPRFEAAPPPPPAPESIWIGGFWATEGHSYRWIAGHYERPPYPGAVWTHPQYEHFEGGYRYHPGYWVHKEEHQPNGHAYGHYKDHDDHDDHHDNGHGHDHDHD